MECIPPPKKKQTKKQVDSFKVASHPGRDNVDKTQDVRMLTSHCDNLSTHHYHPIYHPCFDMQSSHEQTTQQYFPAVAMLSRKKTKAIELPFFSKDAFHSKTFVNIPSDYASRSPTSVRRVLDENERRATTHSLAGYIICLGWYLAFLMLFWPIHKTRYQSVE